MPVGVGRSRARKEAVEMGKAPVGLPFSPGVKFGELLFISGQGATNEKGKVVGDDIKTQTRLTLKNFQRIVERAGTDMSKVLQTTVYLKDLTDFAAMNEVYCSFFNEPRPARATVQVADLLLGMKVEIQGIAHLPSGGRRARS